VEVKDETLEVEVVLCTLELLVPDVAATEVMTIELEVVLVAIEG